MNHNTYDILEGSHNMMLLKSFCVMMFFTGALAALIIYLAKKYSK